MELELSQQRRQVQVQTLPASRLQTQARRRKDRNLRGEGGHRGQDRRGETQTACRKQIKYTSDHKGPLVTYDIFMKWKEDRKIRKEAEFQKKRED